MNSSLNPESLIEAGLLQFGRFIAGDQVVPVQMRFDLLPSYPQVLGRLAEACAAQIASQGQVERLLCVADALPLGTLTSALTSIPLVYSRGSGASPVHDLVGAYDIGHPSTLICHFYRRNGHVDRLRQDAQSVGLEVTGIITLIDPESREDATVRSLFSLNSLTQTLLAKGRLSPQMATQILAWGTGQT
jgi:hypothetical protein